MRGDYCWKVTVTQGTVFCYDVGEGCFYSEKNSNVFYGRLFVLALCLLSTEAIF